MWVGGDGGTQTTTDRARNDLVNLLSVRRTDGENLQWPYIGVPSDYPQPGPSGANNTSE